MRPFDLDRFLRASRKLDLTGIDFDAVPDHPLAPSEVRCLTYMMDIETHTIVYLKEVLATSAALDPDVTAFLSLWVYEEFWHGEALSRFLKAAGERFEPDRPTRVRRYAERHVDRLTALVLRAAAGSRHLPAAHMTWGAVNELSTLTGYEAIVARTRHPILAELLRRIIKDERRHFAFYLQQARLRLEASALARRAVRWALGRFWAPVGTGVRPREETDFLIVALFGDAHGAERLARLDARLERLPGLHGLGLLQRARRTALARSATTRAAARSGRGPATGRATRADR